MSPVAPGPAPDPDPAAPDPEEERRRRQAPRYGEYATPEEVAALRGPDAPPLAPAEPARLPPPSGRPAPGAPPPGHARPAGWDGVATIGLLAFGAYNVASSVGVFLDLRTLLARAADSMGIDGFRAPSWTPGVGIGLVVLWTAMLVVAIVWSVLRLRSGRIAFWVPLTIGVAALVIASLVVAIVLSASGAVGVLQNQG